MSAEDFFRLFEPLQTLPSDSNSLLKMNKQQLAEHLISAFEVLRTAEKAISSQSDTLMKSTNELIKQCEKIRLLEESNAQRPITSSKAKVKTAPSVPTHPLPIILKQVS